MRGVSVTAAADLPEEERAEHESYMSVALDLVAAGPGPFATVIADRKAGRIVCQGVNNAGESRILHGEIVAILNGAKIEPRLNWRGLTLYTSAEPCPMCMSAIVWHRIPEMVYGTSVDDLIAMGINQFCLDSPAVAAAAPFYGGRIIAGVLKDRADAFYRDWASRRG
jgi:tRNA(Arg) A34 adenosine deaminase TadA